MGLRDKLIHYTNDLGDVDLKQEAIATIEHIAQYMDEDELLHHSRPLAIAYLALTEDASVPVTRCKDCRNHRELNRKDRLESGYAEGVLWCMNRSDGVWADGFCSDGEPKEV